MRSAAHRATVLFSTTILSLVETRAIVLAQFSLFVKSASTYNKNIFKKNHVSGCHSAVQ